MKVVLNGEEKQLPDRSSVSRVVALVGASQGERGVAVAVGGEVVPRAEWEERILSEGDAIEVVHAVQGG